jgi:hypothetical protein
MRNNGFYHIKYRGDWTVGRWYIKQNLYPQSTSGYWTVLEYTGWFADNELDEVGKEIVR